MKRVILFRHGKKQKRDRIKDRGFPKYIRVGLDKEGINQISLLGEKLKKEFPELVKSEKMYSSTFPRAVQSGEIIRSSLGIKELIPIFEFGELFVHNFKDVPEFPKRHEYQREAFLNPDKILPSGYSYKQRFNEIDLLLREMLLNQDNILISTHGLVIKAICYFNGFNAFGNDVNDLSIVGKDAQNGSYLVLGYQDDKFSLLKPIDEK